MGAQNVSTTDENMIAEMTAVKIATEYFMIVYIGFVGWMMRCVTRSVGLYLYMISRELYRTLYIHVH